MDKTGNSKRVYRGRQLCVIALGCFLCILFVYLIRQCNDFVREELVSAKGQSYEKAEVTDILKDNLAEDGKRYGNQVVMVHLLSGAQKGQVVEATSPNGTLFGAVCTVGMNVIVIVSRTDNTSVVTVYSKDRGLCIYAFLLFFVGIVCLIGGKQGVKAVISLMFTFVCVVAVLFPLLYRGWSPVLTTIGICMLATVVTLILIGGFTSKTVSAMVGTTAGVTIAAVTALVFGKMAGISGFNVPEIETLNYVAEYCALHIGELLFAGIIISSLGAVMDVGMSISSTIQEIHMVNPKLGRMELFKSGIQVGRDMMGTMVNTLILAYVGGSITTLMINYAYRLPYQQLLNSYNVGIEIMQGVSGSVGVVMTVPITAGVAVLFVKKNNIDLQE